MLPASAWKPGICQDGSPEKDKHVAEVTHLMSRAGKWPGGLRWIVRRAKPYDRHVTPGQRGRRAAGRAPRPW